MCTCLYAPTSNSQNNKAKPTDPAKKNAIPYRNQVLPLLNNSLLKMYVYARCFVQRYRENCVIKVLIS